MLHRYLCENFKTTASFAFLVKVPPEPKACRRIGAVAERDERPAQDVRMETVNGLGGQFINSNLLLFGFTSFS